MREYDILVIGSGGGTKISTPASKLGYKACIVEKDRWGGTCLNRGCIPSKMLIHPAEIIHAIETASKYDIYHKGYDIDFRKLVERVSATIDSESESIVPQYEENPNLDYFMGTARFVDDRTVEVNGERLRGEKVYLAVGTRPLIPNIPGLADVPFMTSKEALRLVDRPKKLIVVGGGYIGAELAFYYSAMGTEVHVLVRSQMLKGADKQVRTRFEEAFSKRVNLHLGHRTDAVRYNEGNYQVDITAPDGSSSTLEADGLLIAAGLVPNSDLLNLEKTGVEVDAKGYVKVDEHLRTTAPNIWALGDVAGNYFFRHSVNFEGEYLLQNTIVDPSDQPIQYGAVPWAVFSSPQVAGVGLTEEEAQAQGLEYVVGFRKYSQSAMGMALLDDEGFVKLLVEKSTHRIIGCHIIGHEASVLIHQVITLMQLNGTLDDLLNTIFIHPALNEIVRNAGRDARAKLA